MSGNKNKEVVNTHMLRYYTPLGHFPRERPTEIFVKRKEPLYGETKFIPEMLHFFDPHRPPVPKHRLLEDDWRAHRKCAYVNARMARMERMMCEAYANPFARDKQDDLQIWDQRHPMNLASTVLVKLPHRTPKTVFISPFQKELRAQKCGTPERKVGWLNTKVNKARSQEGNAFFSGEGRHDPRHAHAQGLHWKHHSSLAEIAPNATNSWRADNRNRLSQYKDHLHKALYHFAEKHEGI